MIFCIELQWTCHVFSQTSERNLKLPFHSKLIYFPKKYFKKLAYICYNKCVLWRYQCWVWKKKKHNISAFCISAFRISAFRIRAFRISVFRISVFVSVFFVSVLFVSVLFVSVLSYQSFSYQCFSYQILHLQYIYSRSGIFVNQK